MKKIFITMMCAVGIVSMMACGGGNGNKSNANDESTVEITMDDVKKLEETGVFGERTKEAAQLAFSKIGLSLDKVTPDYKWLDTDTIKLYRGMVYQGQYEGSAVFLKKDMSETNLEELQAYVRKIYALTQDIADDKKVIYGFEMKSNADEAHAEWLLDDILAQPGIFGLPKTSYDWGFKREGKLMRMFIELLDANKNYPARLQIRFYSALQKSFSDTMNDLEKALEDPEVEKAVKDALK